MYEATRLLIVEVWCNDNKRSANTALSNNYTYNVGLSSLIIGGFIRTYK